MASEKSQVPLPKFGEWDVNNPASAEGFTVIFSKARDEKKSSRNATGRAPSQRKQDHQPRPDQRNNLQNSSTNKKWFCCF